MKLHKTTEKIRRVIDLLEDAQSDAFRFDNGNNKAGKRIRKVFMAVIKELMGLRKSIQKIRYYREALSVYSGKRRHIEKLEYKERKYGPIDKIAKLQIVQNREIRALRRN